MGMHGLSLWNNDSAKAYAVAQINLGNNPLSKAEIVSALNSFNLTIYLYHYNYPFSTGTYNPKVYLSTIQTTAKNWLYDNNPGLKDLPNLPGNADGSSYEKSGSWP